MGDESTSEISRRRGLSVMAAVATAGIAGCSRIPGEDGVGDSGATDVIAYSAASEPVTVSVTITATRAENPHTTRTLSLSPGEVVDPVNSEKRPTNTTEYTVDVTVEDEPSERFEWTDQSVELAPLWVRIDGTGNIKFLLQAG